MIFNETIFQWVVVGLSAFGLWVANHIRSHKQKKTPLVCMVGFDCHSVVHSDYSKFFGIRVEMLGMLYYAIVAALYLLMFALPKAGWYSMSLIGLTAIISLVAFLFSFYLICVQIFILRKGCSWCIVSAIISALIFFINIEVYGSGVFAKLFLM